MDELTQPQSSTLRFRREVADRFGVLPNFFCSAEAAPGLVDVDPTRFVQILSNLLNNAAKFTNNGGSVRISARITPPAGADIRHVSISVVDSGIGMSPELLPRVFELVHPGRDTLVATRTRHRPRTRTSTGGTSRRTSRRPK